MVIEVDNVLFIMLMMNIQLLYFDVVWVGQQLGFWGEWLVNLMFIFLMMVGLLVVQLMLGIIVVNFGFFEVLFFKLVFYGDMFYVEIVCIGKCELKSWFGEGIVIFEYIVCNQYGEVVVCVVCMMLV